MTEKLKPCPFQKEGETHDVRFVELKPGYGQVGCADCGFWFPSDEVLTKAEAFERWNTRYKRTCKSSYCKETDERQCHERGGTLQACAMFDPDVDGFVSSPKFCPNCGAEVIDGD